MNLLSQLREYQAAQKKRREDSITQAGELLIDVIGRLTAEDMQKIRKILELWGPNNG